MENILIKNDLFVFFKLREKAIFESRCGLGDIQTNIRWVGLTICQLDIDSDLLKVNVYFCIIILK